MGNPDHYRINRPSVWTGQGKRRTISNIRARRSSVHCVLLHDMVNRLSRPDCLQDRRHPYSSPYVSTQSAVTNRASVARHNSLLYLAGVAGYRHLWEIKMELDQILKPENQGIVLVWGETLARALYISETFIEKNQQFAMHGTMIRCTYDETGLGDDKALLGKAGFACVLISDKLYEGQV